MSARVAIAGGGLAGLSCAKALCEQGYEVELFEGLPYLGGRASTFLDDDGDWVEQGLHLFLGAYTELKGVLADLKRPPDEVLFWMKEIRFQDPEGKSATYAINPLVAPFRTIGSALGQNDYLGPFDKLRLLPIVAPSLANHAILARTFDGMSVVDWWRRLRGSEAVLERFLRPFCRAIQFTDADEFSAYAFLGLVHNIARDVPSSLAGGYVGPRDRTIFRPFGRYLHEHGVRIHTGVKLVDVLYRHEERPERRRVEGLVLDNGERVDADLYVLAVPVWEVAPLLPSAMKNDPFFGSLADLPVAPAISVQLWFDEPVVDGPHYTLVARSHACVYQDQSTNAYIHHGSRLSFILSPADDLLELPDEAIVQLTLDSLARVQPRATAAHLEKYAVLKHTQHLLRPRPGVLSRRPTQRTPVPNLFFAGDWTQQDFFGSQEGAVRGGLACAQAIFDVVGAPTERRERRERGGRPEIRS